MVSIEASDIENISWKKVFNLNFHSTFFQLQPNKNLTSFRTSTESVVYKNLTSFRTEIEFDIREKRSEIIYLPTKPESDL